MLVLTRQRDDSIIIGDEIEVKVVDIRGDKVRLGITAPRSVTVHRKEIYEQIRDENKAAAQLKPEDVPNMTKPPENPPQIAPPSPAQIAPPFPRLATENRDTFLLAAIEEARAGLHE